MKELSATGIKTIKMKNRENKLSCDTIFTSVPQICNSLMSNSKNTFMKKCEWGKVMRMTHIFIYIYIF